MTEMSMSKSPKCPKCGNQMRARIFDEEEGKWYYECRSMKLSGKICFNTEWEEDLL